MARVDDDDGVLDNWDDADDQAMEELGRRMDKRVEQQRKQQAKAAATTAQSTATENSIFTSDGQVRQPVVQSSEDRTQYVPQIRLLQRPNGERPDPAAAAIAAAKANKPPNKTLEERQQEYAEKRARILGSPATANTTAPPTKKSPAPR